MQEENKGDKIRRVLQLYAKLSDGYVINKAEEAAYYGVTERSITRDKSSPNLCVNSSFSYVVLSTLLLSSRDLTEWSLVYHSTLSYQRFYDLHSIHYDHLEGLHQLI